MPERAGTIIARLLAGAWRADDRRARIDPDELDGVAPLLYRTGAGALAWWALRHSDLHGSSTVERFRRAYQIHTLEAEVHAQRGAEVLARMESAGVQTLLVKGWAIARLYPEVGLRPYTDLDLIVRPDQLSQAWAALRQPPAIDAPVDLVHKGPPVLNLPAFDALAARAKLARLGDQPVRVLSPEDQLRLLALHALRHGVFRPIWLVDLAVALEARPASFDWDRCLGSDPRQADWVTCALALSGRLLDARLEGTPAEARSRALPPWLTRAVLRNWERGTSTRAPVFRPLVAELRHPGRAWMEARRRWDRPIESTMQVGCAFNHLPRWPFQVAAIALRALKPRALRKPSTSRRGRSRGHRAGDFSLTPDR